MPALSFALNRPLSAPFGWYSVGGGLYVIGVGFLISRLGMVGAVGGVVAPLALALVLGVLREPRLGLFVYIQLSFMVGFSRFLPVAVPVGLAIDAVLAITLLGLFINGRQMNWRRLRNPVFTLIAIWFLYTVIELFNPEAPYRPAWFFHVRAFSLHWLLIAVVVLVTPISRSDIRVFFHSWLAWSFLAALWAFKQQYIGLSPAEVTWLNSGFNARTHLLFGQLRCFSFYSDAAQFGAEMAGVTVVALILVFEEKRLPYKLVYGLLALIFFWGYAISGTRSALFVLAAGFTFYLLLKRDFVKLLLGTAFSIPLFLLLMYTSVGSANYQVQRMRSALTPMNDPSFLLRLQNQEKLRSYLADLPFGAGIGTSADMGARFSPWHWAAQIPPDSWYVEIWIETGRVGLTLYLMMLAGIVGLGVYQLSRLKDPWLATVMYALLAEFFGIAVMGYSNPVLGQFPTNSVVFISTILVASSYRWNATPAVHQPARSGLFHPYSINRRYESV